MCRRIRVWQPSVSILGVSGPIAMPRRDQGAFDTLVYTVFMTKFSAAGIVGWVGMQAGWGTSPQSISKTMSTLTTNRPTWLDMGANSIETGSGHFWKASFRYFPSHLHSKDTKSAPQGAQTSPIRHARLLCNQLRTPSHVERCGKRHALSWQPHLQSRKPHSGVLRQQQRHERSQ